MKFVNAIRLFSNDASPVEIKTLAIANAATVTTSPIKIDKNVGFLVLRLVENKAGGNGSIAVYTEYSDDNVVWDRPYTSDLAGTITIEGNVVTAQQNVTRRIIHTARLARYVRYNFVASADSQITADVTFQEEAAGF